MSTTADSCSSIKIAVSLLSVKAVISVASVSSGPHFRSLCEVWWVKCYDAMYSSRVATSSETELCTYRLYLRVYMINLEGQVFAYISSLLWSARDIHLLCCTYLLLSFQLTIHLSLFFSFAWRCLVSIHKFCANLQIDVNNSVLTGFLVECSLQLICWCTLWMGRAFSSVLSKTETL
jgi:hypothetical protein